MKFSPEFMQDLLAKIHAQRDTLIRTNPDIPADLEDKLYEANEIATDWDAHNQVAETISDEDFEKSLVLQAKIAHSLSWKWVEDDAEAFHLMRATAFEAYKHSPKAIAFGEMSVLMSAPGAFQGMSFPGKWAHYGFQTVDIEERLAASWCATGLKPEFVNDAETPWPAFLVRMPKFLRHLTVKGERIRAISVSNVKLPNRYPFVMVNLLTANKYRTLQFENVGAMAQMKDDHVDLVINDMVNMGGQKPAEAYDVRLAWAVSRIVLGACLTIGGDPGVVKHYAPTPGLKRASMGSPRAGTPVEAELWKIGRPVKLDLRREVHGWLSGEIGKRVQVRTLVAGHWKRQPFGTGRTQRKWIQVEPYWRGPDNAAMPIRIHTIRS